MFVLIKGFGNGLAKDLLAHIYFVVTLLLLLFSMLFPYGDRRITTFIHFNNNTLFCHPFSYICLWHDWMNRLTYGWEPRRYVFSFSWCIVTGVLIVVLTALVVRFWSFGHLSMVIFIPLILFHNTKFPLCMLLLAVYSHSDRADTCIFGSCFALFSHFIFISWTLNSIFYQNYVYFWYNCVCCNAFLSVVTVYDFHFQHC